jgi:hypothetical protein
VKRTLSCTVKALDPDAIAIEVSEDVAKAPSPIVVTLAGISIVVRPLPRNAFAPIEVTLASAMLERPEQPANACEPIVVTEDGIVTLVTVS